ncbi:hypothetical protein L3Q82_005296 [Scortum barcoo]|uniref:Uncharacterized protein n=1 Tax=Scortum barcoo TaxID=214431 RepID=A0ACB8V9Z0_9TELE|nr:hypothetical protein L3Q82_005296 [Scortum barcoo]
MQQHEAHFATAATEIQQATITQAAGLAALTSQVQQLMAAFTAATAAASPPPPPAPAPAPAPPGPVPEPRVGSPERYAGDPGSCNPFIMNCSILYALQPQTFSSEGARVAFAINHLTGRARQSSSFRPSPPAATEGAPSNSHTRDSRDSAQPLYCGQAGHFVSRCRAKGRTHQ